MSRNESDREDLMAEATALRRRLELQVFGETQSVIAGFWDAGRVSISFGSDPVYHFEEQGSLRRAFVAGRLYRTQGTTLAPLTRERTDETTTLVRHGLTTQRKIQPQPINLGDLGVLAVSPPST